MLNINLPYDPDIPLLVCTEKELEKYVYKTKENLSFQLGFWEFPLFLSVISGDWEENRQKKMTLPMPVVILFLSQQGVEMLIAVKRKAYAIDLWTWILTVWVHL